MSRARWHSEQGAASVVQTALILPLLALALGALLHLGLYMQSRAVTIQAVQQGLTAATLLDGTTTTGQTITHNFLTNQAPVDIIAVTATGTATAITMTATVRSPAMVPGLPRDITITHTATRERWIS